MYTSIKVFELINFFILVFVFFNKIHVLINTKFNSFHDSEMSGKRRRKNLIRVTANCRI